MLKLAFFAHPIPYGLYTVYKNLRFGLALEGIELRWTAFAHHAGTLVKQPEWESESAFGEAIEAPETEGREQASAMIRHLEESGYQGICVSPPYERVQMNLPRYLDPKMLRVLTVQSMAIGVTPLTRPLRNHVHAAIGASLRVQEDLIHRAGYRPEIVASVPNGIAPEPYAECSAHRARLRANSQGPTSLKLLYLGRIEENQKGVFWLVPLMKRLAHSDCSLTVAGDGPDLPELKRRAVALGPRVRFVGVVQPTAVPALMAEHDVLLLLSRSEGMPNVLIEAMAAGCVPVSSRIRGLTDFMISHGINGMLFPTGDVEAAASTIRTVAEDRERLRRMSEAARAEFLARFTSREMGRAYGQIIHRVVADPPKIADPIPLSEWSLPAASAYDVVRRFVPRSLKNRIQQWLG